MERAAKIGVYSVAALLAAPAVARAEAPVTDPVNIAVSGIGLVVAIILLIEALGLRRVALGGAIVERISYDILAIVCLAASAIAAWAQNFVQGITADQVQLAAQVLVIVAMGLLAAYFYSVKTALQRYLSAMTGAEQLSADSSDEESPDA